MEAKKRALDYIWAVEIGNEPDRRLTWLFCLDSKGSC
jgi:hypothetical protein